VTQTNEIILSGSGGQGLILAGQILAEAVIRDGKNTVQTQSYGPEARGGASKAEVIISNGDIDYPKVTKPNIVLAMSQEALNRYADKLDSNGTLIVDSTYVRTADQTGTRMITAPFSRLAKESLGKEMVANVVALGALAAITGVVSLDSLKQALLSRVPPGTENLNKKALELGWKSARQAAA
jgi:2-oxoglutarate ferredoxin oxidoreductase subunit gamma